MSLLQEIQNQIRNTMSEQDKLYDQIVFSKILLNAPPEEMTKAYAEYEQKLGGFNARNFNKTINAVIMDNEDVLDQFADEFCAIPKYLSARNNWDDKVQDILSQDGSNQDKQQLIDVLDRHRTNAHNGVISLMNHLNAYADKKGFGTPYPHNGIPFDKTNPAHREDAAIALTSQAPLLELTNALVQEKFKETGRTETLRDKYRTMSAGDVLRDVAKRKGIELPKELQKGFEL